jgi:sulfoxide reductase heme-binding subunit YedZ
MARSLQKLSAHFQLICDSINTMFADQEKALLRFTTLHRREITFLFLLVEIALVLIIVLGFAGFFLFPDQLGPLLDFLTSEFMAHHFGIYAAITFCLTLTPSIMQRINIRFPFSLYIQSLLILVRRHMGILMYMFALAHGLLMGVFPRLAFGGLLQMPIEEVVGLTALLLTTPLFLSANDYSVKLLGRNWKKLHRLSYVIVWVIFLHVVLVSERSVTILVSTTGILEIISWLVFWQRQKQKLTSQPAQPLMSEATPQA